MTLQELKNHKILPNDIKDNDLIKILNEVLKVSPEVKTMDYDITDLNIIDKVKFSPQMINAYVDKIMSSKSKSKPQIYKEVLEYLNKTLGEAQKKKGFTEEVKDITTLIGKMNQQKQLFENMESMFEQNKDLLSTVDPNNLKKLNKEALAVMMSVMLGDQNQIVTSMQAMLEQIKILNAKVDSLTQELETSRASTPNGVTPGDSDFEAPEDPKFITAEDLEQQVTQTQQETKEMQPLIKKNSLHDLRNRKIIPSSIKEEELIDYCNNVLNFEPKVTSIESVITEKQIESLQSSTLMSNATLRTEISDSHKTVMSSYASLIKNYQTMLEGMHNKPGFEKEVSEITDLIDRLQAQQEAYKTTVDGFEVQDMGQYFDFSAPNQGELSQSMSERAKKVTTDKQEKLTELDSEIAILSSKKDRLEKIETKFFFNKIKNNMQLKTLSSRIERLRKKQGKIQSSQKRIINANTARYVKKMEKQFKKYMKEQEKINLAVQEKHNKLEDLNAKQSKLDKLNKKLVDLEEKKKEASKLQQSRLENKQKRVESRRDRVEKTVKRLQEKVGKVDLSKQYQSTFEESYAFAI